MLAMNEGQILGFKALEVPICLFIAFVIAHVATRFLAPGADPAILPITFALSGIGIAVVAVSIVGLIWFKAKPESFKNMKNEFSFLTFKTSFKKQEKIFTDEN